MANDAYCCDDGEQELAELNEQEYQLYLHELQTLGVKNETNRSSRTKVWEVDSNGLNEKIQLKSLPLPVRLRETGDKPF